MTIVASNSLTVSNVNDGTITHTGYANSADGTDGFTTVYPNLNLLNFNSGVNFGKYYGWAADVTSYSGYRAYFKKVKVTPNNQYTISANWSNTEWLNVYAFANESDTTAIARYGYSGGVASWDTTFGGGYAITKDTTFTVPANVNYIGVSYSSISRDNLTLQTLLNGKPKLEIGSTATPWMPSSSEVTTADWPSYIGQYTDFTQADSTNPSDYTWSLIRGNDGADGQDGKDGTNGKDGDPGKVVSDTEPTIKFKGLTWKYIGVTAFNASDGTNIQPNTEYYWNDSNWVINLINAQNINVDTLTALTANLGDATAGSITLEKGSYNGASIKDGLVKTWGISVLSDSNYPDGNSYTSMGTALDSGGISYYSAAYGQTLLGDSVINDAYKVATFRAISHNNRSNVNVGLVLDVSNPIFPLTINGDATITGALNIPKITYTFNSSNFSGISIYKWGNIISMRFVTTNSSAVSVDGNIGSIPSGCIPSVQWHVTLEANNGITYRATLNTDGLMKATMAIPANTQFRCTVTYQI